MLSPQSLKGMPAAAAWVAPGATRLLQLLATGLFARTLRTKRNSTSNAALTPPLWVMPEYVFQTRGVPAAHSAAAAAYCHNGRIVRSASPVPRKSVG